jgi:hypothetical protein
VANSTIDPGVAPMEPAPPAISPNSELVELITKMRKDAELRDEQMAQMKKEIMGLRAQQQPKLGAEALSRVKEAKEGLEQTMRALEWLLSDKAGDLPDQHRTMCLQIQSKLADAPAWLERLQTIIDIHEQ